MKSRQPNVPVRLGQNARIAVIGGGPAGTGFALAALKIAAEIGLRLNITIFEHKNLSNSGPSGCNMCAGILSRRAVQGLADLGITLPPEIILAYVRSYRIHWGSRDFPIRPPQPDRQVLSVYRAGGPRQSSYPAASGFDAYLVSQAEARGARIVQEWAKSVSFDPLPRVYFAGRSESFDMVVLATGVNSSGLKTGSHCYVRPKTELMAQDSLLIETDDVRRRMDGTVHVYFDQPPGLVFGALVPKGHFATVSLLGERMSRDYMQQFLTAPQVSRVVGKQALRACGCRPRVAVGPARGFYGDRFVAVGDSSVTRLYKDGIGSALVTARAAAETALQHGVGREAFARHYAPVCRAIARDNRLGRLVFGMTAQSKKSAFFMRALARALQPETAATKNAGPLNEILWALFTGDANYAQIFRLMFQPRCIQRIGRALLWELCRIPAPHPAGEAGGEQAI